VAASAHVRARAHARQQELGAAQAARLPEAAEAQRDLLAALQRRVRAVPAPFLSSAKTALYFSENRKTRDISPRWVPIDPRYHGFLRNP